jgi:hypothetical protein
MKMKEYTIKVASYLLLYLWTSILQTEHRHISFALFSFFLLLLFYLKYQGAKNQVLS